MRKNLSYSNLVRKMLEEGRNSVRCIVSNDSDEHAMTILDNAEHSFFKHIVSFRDGHFFCQDRTAWKYAVPIKKVEMTQQEVGL